MNRTDTKKAVFIIARETFRDEELFETQKALESAGVQTTIASSQKGTCKGKLGATARASMLITEINPDDFDAVVFVGGAGAMEYFDNKTALALAKSAFEKAKVVAAICIAPRILANAGLLKGKKATCFQSERDNITALGARFEDTAVACDGKVITACGPGASVQFGEAIARALRHG